MRERKGRETGEWRIEKPSATYATASWSPVSRNKGPTLSRTSALYLLSHSSSSSDMSEGSTRFVEMGH